MANDKNGGLIKDSYKSYDFYFFEDPSRYGCFICCQICYEPQQLRCCGKIVCLSCLRTVRTQQHSGRSNLECPHCRQQGELETFPDKMSDRAIKEMRVKCPNVDDGCTTVGELLDVLAHVEGNDERACPYQTVKCPLNCGGSFHRRSLSMHVTHGCYNRRAVCEFCGEEGTFRFVTTAAHLSDCKKHLVSCPNGCGATVKRQDSATHLEDCPNVVVGCPFSGVGCHAHVVRSNLQSHLESSQNNHLLLLMQQVMLLSANVQKKDTEIASLKAQLGEVKQDLMKARSVADRSTELLQGVECRVAVLEAQRKPTVLGYLTDCKDGGVVVRMDEFKSHRTNNEVWYSHPFYLHPKGYKMCLKVFANGTNACKGTHVSVYLTLMRGEYDEKLKWPLQGNFKVSVLNQLADASHYEKDIKYNLTVPGKATQKVTGSDMATVGHGLHDFLPHSYLGYLPLTLLVGIKYYYYNANDSMYFRVQYVYTHDQTLMEPQASTISFRPSKSSS